MKREALIRDLRQYAKDKGLVFQVYQRRGKGSHYQVQLGEHRTTVQSGELSPLLVKRIKEQLKVNPA